MLMCNLVLRNRRTDQETDGSQLGNDSHLADYPSHWSCNQW